MRHFLRGNITLNKSGCNSLVANFKVGKDSRTPSKNCHFLSAAILDIFHIFMCNQVSLYMFKECHSIFNFQLDTQAERGLVNFSWTQR